MNHYIALLRGINVGGKNIIKMELLRKCFEEMSFVNVKSYIQSGNILFSSTLKSSKTIATKIEKGILDEFKIKVIVVVISDKELDQIVNKAPKNFGKEPDKYRYDVIFLKEPLIPSDAIKEIDIKEGVDQVWSGKGVLYFSRLTEKAISSRLSKIVLLPIYKSMTIRNWNTTTKLVKLFEEY